MGVTKKLFGEPDTRTTTTNDADLEVLYGGAPKPTPTTTTSPAATTQATAAALKLQERTTDKKTSFFWDEGTGRAYIKHKDASPDDNIQKSDARYLVNHVLKNWDGVSPIVLGGSNQTMLFEAAALIKAYGVKDQLLQWRDPKMAEEFKEKYKENIDQNSDFTTDMEKLRDPAVLKKIQNQKPAARAPVSSINKEKTEETRQNLAESLKKPEMASILDKAKTAPAPVSTVNKEETDTMQNTLGNALKSKELQGILKRAETAPATTPKASASPKKEYYLTKEGKLTNKPPVSGAPASAAAQTSTPNIPPLPTRESMVPPGGNTANPASTTKSVPTTKPAPFTTVAPPPAPPLPSAVTNLSKPTISIDRTVPDYEVKDKTPTPAQEQSLVDYGITPAPTTTTTATASVKPAKESASSAHKSLSRSSFSKLPSSLNWPRSQKQKSESAPSLPSNDHGPSNKEIQKSAQTEHPSPPGPTFVQVSGENKWPKKQAANNEQTNKNKTSSRDKFRPS